MSFIYDNQNLINELLKSAEDFESKFTKKGQDAQQDRSNLQALIKNLQDQLNPSGASKDPNAVDISHQGDPSNRPALTSNNLESLGDLIKWLATNKITINNQIVAYDTDPNSDKYTLYQLETHTANIDERGKDPNRFYVDIDLLKKYIVSLQEYETKNPNQPMKVQLQNLINETNQNLGTQINQQYKAPDKILPDTTILDNTPKDFTDPRSSLAAGNVVLTYGDLKDDTTFNNWLSKNSVSVKVGNEQVTLNDSNFDRCSIVNVLFERAKNHISRALDATMKENATIYMRLIESLSSQMQCKLTGITSPQVGTADSQGGQQAKPGSNAENSLATQNIINEIVETLPLTLQNIDFNRIKDFFGKMAQLMGTNSTVMNYITNTINLMKQASYITENNDSIFQLGITPTALTNMFKDKKTPGKQFFTMVQLLDQIVDNVRAVVGYFMAQYINRVSDNQRALIYGQIGKRPDDNSIYSRNIDYLTTWMHTPINER